MPRPASNDNSVDDVRDRVRAELTARNLSVRQASFQGGISNTAWHKYESTGVLTPRVREGIARAFGWDLDWPTNPPPLPEARQDEVMSMLKTLLARIDELERKVDRLAD